MTEEENVNPSLSITENQSRQRMAEKDFRRGRILMKLSGGVMVMMFSCRRGILLRLLGLVRKKVIRRGWL